jgi:hypothetical protein
MFGDFVERGTRCFRSDDGSGVVMVCGRRSEDSCWLPSLL